MTAQVKGSEEEASDDLASGIFGVQSYEYSVPRKKNFLPWHRPRKQFVRNDQWCYYIKELLTDLKIESGSLTYFGLPGVDLLDIRYFGTVVCEPRSLKLRFLGFNSGAAPNSDEQIEMNISLDEISKSPSHDPQSEIIAEDIRELANEDSIAWRKTLDIGPYDVVNLDLCDGFGAKPPDQINETYYNAVNRLMTMQVRKKTPWLLLLTTRVGKEHVHSKVLDILSSLYKKNMKECPPFTAGSIKKFHIADDASLHAAMKDSAGLQSVFLVGLCKWFLGLSILQNPPSKMDVKSVYGYRVKQDSKAEDMVSIAIRFDPTHGPLEDPAKLSSISAARLDECELATKALNRVGALLNVDDYLASENLVKKEMVEAMCELLESARYDTSKYRSWACA